MDEPIDIPALGQLIRQRGIASRPQAIEQVSEVRSDCFVKLPPLSDTYATFALASVVIEWRFRLSYGKIAEFHDFLAKNERFIADSCQKVLAGVHYRGTFMALDGQRAAYATIWGYDSWEAQDQWSKILGNQKSRFYRALRNLRSYWISDPNGTQEHFGAAAGIDLKQGFFAITLDAHSGPEPIRRRSARRRP
jgi:hypothetical protein